MVLSQRNLYFPRIQRGSNIVRAPISPLGPRMNSTEDNYIYRLAMNIADSIEGAQWLSGRVLDWRPTDRGCEPHRRHCVVVLEQDTFILA